MPRKRAPDAPRVVHRTARSWRVGQLIRALTDKAEVAGIAVTLVDERGTSSPPGRAAASSPQLRRGSRTAVPGRTCQVCTQHDVTRGDASIAARRTVPWPASARPARHLRRRGVARVTARSPEYSTSIYERVH